MPKWININERQPINQGNYYVKVSNRKDILDLRRLCQYEGISDDVFWLDEKTDSNLELLAILKEKDLSKLNNFSRESITTAISLSKKGSAKIDVIKNILNYDYDGADVLQKIFGVKKGKKLENILFNIKQSKIKKNG